MLRAVIFDFNGVLVDDESIHMKMFQKVLREEGLSLSKEDYYARYLGMDDRACFKTVYREHGKRLKAATLDDLLRRKALYYRGTIEKKVRVFPGVRELIPALSVRFPLAIASGALRSEINLLLDRSRLKNCFQAIVSAEDVLAGKPDPEIFLKALSLLNEKLETDPILPAECLVIEDSKEGIRGANRAGIKCLAVTNSHPRAELKEADAVVRSLEEVDVAYLENLVSS